MAFRREPFPEDVANRVLHDYAPSDVGDVFQILAGVKDYHDPDTVDWIQFASLWLAVGRKNLIGQWIEQGNQDPRDLQLSVEAQYGGDWIRDYILYDRRT